MKDQFLATMLEHETSMVEASNLYGHCHTAETLIKQR